MNQRPSWCLVSRLFDTLGPLSVHPASPILLTKNGPLGDQIRVKTSVKKVLLRVHLEFENKLKLRKLQDF